MKLISVRGWLHKDDAVREPFGPAQSIPRNRYSQASKDVNSIWFAGSRMVVRAARKPVRFRRFAEFATPLGVANPRNPHHGQNHCHRRHRN